MLFLAKTEINISSKPMQTTFWDSRMISEEMLTLTRPMDTMVVCEAVLLIVNRGLLHGSEGSRLGKVLAEERAKKYSNGYALIVVAGMNYAELVEARDNKSVLASAELLAHAEFYNVMEKLRNQVAK